MLTHFFAVVTRFIAGNLISAFSIQCALCRAAVPQTPSLIARMGANAPAAIPTLVRGCIQAYEKASQSRSKNHAIASSARQSIRSLASLSVREACRIRSLLERDGVMIDVQLEIAMKHDYLLALCLLADSLSLKDETSTQDIVIVPARYNVEEGSSCVKVRTMASHLMENSTLLTSTIAFLVDDFVTLVGDVTSRKLFTRLSFTLSAISWVFLRVPANNLLATMSAVQQDALLDSLEKMRRKCAKEDTAFLASDRFHRFYSLLISCHLSYCMSLCSSCMSTDSYRQKIMKSLQDTLQMNNSSRESETIVTSVQDSLYHNNPHELCSVLFRVLSTPERIKSELPAWFPISVTEKAIKTCQWLSTNSKGAFSVKSSDELHAQNQIYRALRSLRQNTMFSDQSEKDCTCLLHKIFTDESLSSSMLLCSAIPAFISLSMKLLHSRNPLKIPLVLPLQVQSLACDFLQTHLSPVISPPGACFLLMMLYSFEFLEEVPDTPFAVDLGEIPVREIYRLCLARSKPIMSQVASDKFLFFIKKMAPDVPFWNQAIAIRNQKDWGTSTKNELRNAIYLGLKQKEDDFSGLVTEKTFLIAAGCLSDADLVTTVVNVISSTEVKARPHYSYGVLCRDPLLVFKCASSVFKKRAFRRIVLFVLSRLLEVNERLTVLAMKDRYAEAEYISVRNCIVLQCLCQFLSAEAVADRCMLSTGLIRRLVASKEGLAAMIAKQVSDDAVVDRFFDTVPEAIDDWKAYSFILAERNTLTSMELLVVSSRVLRVVVYQGLRLELESQKLLRAVMAHLTACFPLVIGPVGVPVSITGEGSVADATKATRQASFRIIKTLSAVRGFQSELKNECITSLQKLAAICKAETPTTSVPSSVATRQKAILVEILEAIQETAESLGIGLQV